MLIVGYLPILIEVLYELVDIVKIYEYDDYNGIFH
jgi:hypothetical protein